jgi:Tol biopolymer transport system component
MPTARGYGKAPDRYNRGVINSWKLALLAVGVAAAAPGCAAGEAPSAGPGNGRIVFQRFDSGLGKTRLYVVQPDGRGLRALTRPTATQDNDSQPDWSPDGRRIVFRRFVDVGLPEERARLFVVRADGSGLRDLTRATCSASCLGDAEPAWSPDGKRIAFVRTIGPPPPARPRVVGIFVMDADGTHVRQLTQRRGTFRKEDHAPSWSPDGKRIAFMSANTTFRPAGASVIYVINADGTRPRLLRSLPHDWPGAGAPAWSPGGKRLLYSTYCWFGTCGQPAVGAQLFTIGADGKGLRRLTRLAGNAFGGRWSPDGRRIVFVWNSHVGPSGDLWTLAVDGTALRRLTNAPDLAARAPDWGPIPR